jgi:tetratricopeptide (TPR) repeat protein
MKLFLALTALILGIVAAVFVWQRTRAPRAPVPAATGVPLEIRQASTPGRRVIFIGLDGADWALLDRYMSSGAMPSLAQLVKEGRQGRLKTLHPPLSPLIWTTMMTGVSPLEHRVLDFLRVNPVSGKREPITSDERKAPAIWNMATMGGKKAGVLGLWATYPAEAINGLVISDRLFTFLYSEAEPPPGVVFPASLDGWARDGLKRAEQEIDLQVLKQYIPSLTDGEYRAAIATTDPYSNPVSALRRILVETRVYDTLGREWFAHERPDVMITYIQGTDSIGHVFAPYAPPRQPSIAADEYARYSGVAEQYFRTIDRMLGNYRQLATETESVLMLASDHGFTWSEGRPTTLSSVANATAARWHTDEGISLLWGPGIPADATDTQPNPLDDVSSVARTIAELIGLPPSKDWAGSATAPRGVDYRAHYVPAAIVAPAPDSATSKVDEETVAKLRALGYIGTSEGGGRAIGTRTAGSFNNEALLLKQQGRTKEAIEAFENALTVDPNLASAAWNLSDLLFAQNQSLDKSDALLVRAFAHGLPEGTKYLIGRAIGYQRNGRIDRSLRLLDQAAAAKADEPEVWLFRGRYRVEANQCQGAINDFQQAARLDAKNAGAFASLGIAQLCAGDRRAARSSFEHSLRLDPNQPKVREYLARVRP